MGVYELAQPAEDDLTTIATYTLETWGAEQAARYLDGLEDCCQLLANTLVLGRTRDHLLPGLLRLEHGKHVVFFRRTGKGIRVLRFLHERMLPELHLFEEQAE